MKLSKVFFASIFLTAVILAVVGGLASTVFASKNVETQPTSEEVQAYQDREAAYNQLIEKANQQLEKANHDLQVLQEQAAQNQPPLVNQQQDISVAVSVEKAGEIAGEVADPGLAATRKPELVDFEGKTAYEVPYEIGSIFIDAQNGSILFNGTIPQEVTLDMASKIASDFLKNTDIVQADQITFRGAPLFRVIYKNSTIVYLDITGQITYILHDSMASRVQTQNNDQGSTTIVTDQDDHEYEDHDDD